MYLTFKLLFDYMSFFVGILSKFSRYKLEKLVEVSEKVLNALMEIIPGEKLVKKFKEKDYKLLNNQSLTDSTVNHFKGLNSIIMTTKYVNSSNIYEKDEELHLNLNVGKGYYHEVAKDEPGDSAMFFNKCSHTFQIAKSKIKHPKVYCKECEIEEEKIECKERSSYRSNIIS